MASLEDLIEQYCPKYGRHAPRQNSPAEMQNHRTEAFIDGIAYFEAIRGELRRLKESTRNGRFFYLSAWWLGLIAYQKKGLRIADEWNYDADFSGFELPPMANETLEHWLKQLVEHGVDVRVLAWMHPLVIKDGRLAAKAGGFAGVNIHTLGSVSQLRRDIGNERVMLNLLGHTFGAAHSKMIVCGDEDAMRAYTSGIDPEASRLIPPGLTTETVKQSKKTTYHADSKRQLDQVCRDLNACEFPQVIYEQLASGLRVLPDFETFDSEVQKEDGIWDFRLDVCRPGWEWKLVLAGCINDKWKSWIFYLKRQADKSAIRIYQFPRGGWHDIGVRVEGRAAGAMHGFFRHMWNEQLGRRVETFKIGTTVKIQGKDKSVVDKIASHDRGWAILPDRTPTDLPANTGKQYVQVLRTLPMMNFTLGVKARGEWLIPDELFRPKKFGVKGWRLKMTPRDLAIPVGSIATQKGYESKRLSFAREGCFEFKEALETAISGAEKYIFIADQALYALEVMDWINARMMQKPNLKVILLYGADPADPPNRFLSEAMNQHLLPNVMQTKTAPQVPKNVVFYEWTGNTVHCKVTIIDDIWCAIGSANCMRRSLYTDIELSVGILEPPTPANELPDDPEEEANPPRGVKAPSFVQRFRRDLWAYYCGFPTVNRTRIEGLHCTALLHLDRALPMWNCPEWGHAPSSRRLRPEIVAQNLNPYPTGASPFSQKLYDLQDPDSRSAF